MSLLAFLCYALIALMTYFVIKLHKRLNYWQSHGIACENPHFIFGNMTGLRTERTFFEISLSYYNKFKGSGPFAGFYWMQNPTIFVLEPSLLKLILIKDFNKFSDHGLYHNKKDDPLTGTLFLLDGPKWKNMRTKLSPAFTSGKTKLMLPIITNIGEEFVRICNAKLKEERSVIEVSDMMACFGSDVIGTCAFGINCNSLADPHSEFLKMSKRSIKEYRCGMLGVAFRATFPDLARALHMKQTPQDIEDYFMGIIRETVAYREQSNVRRNDFLDILIDMKNNKFMKTENGEEMTSITFEELAAQVFLFLIAGFESSSATLSFALYELAQHENIQQRVREEVTAVLQQHNQEFTYECMKEMRYLDQVISETLRLYTVFPLLMRVCRDDYIVPDHPKYVIKKGMQVLIPAGALHRDERYYPQPNEFNFLPEKVKERDSILWLPFGDGPRNCIGMRFGLMQTRVGLALLLKNFQLSVCPQTQVPLKYDKENFLMSPQSGIHLQLEKVRTI